ncbi:DUF2971 domain-containing protein [Shewanella sp.]|uniref:DUF2971 domain-containing protein n=1 Tax=Shewanella sp. TaxID=50422 RepID=UPI003A96B842
MVEISTFYRFRSINRLLGEFKELEKQSIFFAPPEILNDPVEGFKDIYWQGDEILWRNLFNHYLLCLMNLCLGFQIQNNEFDLNKNLDTCLTIDDLNNNFKDEFSIISEQFLNSKHLKILITGISNHRKKVDKSELQFYLKAVHFLALHCIYERLSEITKKITNPFKKCELPFLGKIDESLFSTIQQLEEKHGEQKLRELFFRDSFFSEQMELMNVLSHEISNVKRTLFTTAFCGLYIKKLENLMFPDWFTACFMSKCSNSSVWGNYGDNHKGVCMIFSAEFDKDGNNIIQLNNAIRGWGVNGALKGKCPFKFHPIKYKNKYHALNFFESIAQIPEPAIYKNWFSWNGITSPSAQKYTEKWRKSHWNNFYKSVTQKTKDWKYENEYRLLICNMSGSYSKNDTTLEYDFKSLKGIIFGINTSDKDKAKIIEIIEKKVQENAHYNFKFYQAYYCRESGEIKHYEISFLNFRNSNKTQ